MRTGVALLIAVSLRLSCGHGSVRLNQAAVVMITLN
jgi:hypothetical protein